MPSTDDAVVVDGVRKTFGSVVAWPTSVSRSGAAKCSVC